MNLEPPPLPPPTRPSSCHLHLDQPFTGFCASCLRERLAGLDPALNHRNPTPSATASSALRAIFKASASASASKCSFHELRRSKSFSGARADGIPVVVEPQRKSCDVRVRNTLWSLFHQDDHNNGGSGNGNPVWGEIEQVPTAKNLNLGFDEVKEEIEEDEEEDGEGEIRVLETETRAEETVAVAEEYQIKEEEEKEDDDDDDDDDDDNVKTMKDHIDLDSHMRNQTVEKTDLKEIAGSFWLAASVLSKKLQKWRLKKKRRSGRESAGSTVRVDKPASSSRHFRETQSEVADYGYGRRSCDMDPRFSLDAGRMSLDDPRYSFDEPRASWDGYLIGRAGAAAAAFPRMPPFMSSVVEDAPASVRRSDNQIPVEEQEPPMNSIDEDPTTMPGGSAQTRDYYTDSSSSSHRLRRQILASGDTEETKWISNSKVSPASMDYFLLNKIADTMHSNSNSLHDDCSESFESAYRDTAAIAGKGSTMKLRRWTKAWKIWGLIHWRGSSKDGENDRYNRGNFVDRSLSESWPELQREVNGVNGNLKGFAFDRKVLRSNSSVSWRSSLSNGTFGGMRSGMEVNGQSKKRREEIVLERNRSARFSPGHFDNGLLRFYLTPLTSGRRNGGGLGKSRSKSSHSFARSMLRLY